MKSYKKLRTEYEKTSNEIKEFDTLLSGIVKETDSLDLNSKDLLKETAKLLDEQHICVGQLVKRGLDDNKAKLRQTKKQDEITGFEAQVHQMIETENKLKIEKKFLSTIREKMARTASQAMAQAKDTIEDLKVRELLILDLTKKGQETEFRLSIFQTLYEETKNLRNKYVA